MKIPTARKLKSGTYFLQLRLGGESIPVTGKTKAECEKRAALIKSEYKNGLRKRSGLTLAEALDKYIKSREKVLSPSTIRGYKEIRKNRFKNYHDMVIDDIDFQQMINDEDCSPKTLKNAWGLVRSVLKQHKIEPNVRLPASPVHEKQWLTPEQIPVFLKAVKGKPCEIPALLALSSLRKSELLGLDWSNVDMKKKIIRVRGAAVRGPDETFVRREQNKTSASVRDIPMIPQLYAALRAVKDKTGPVITCHFQTPYKQIRALCEANNLPNVGLHGLRHSFASLCYHLGMSELETMKLGGWSDYNTMRKIYTHLSDADSKKSAEKLQKFFKNAN